MLINTSIYQQLNNLKNIKDNAVQLIAVSKTKPVEAIQQLYNLGHKHFGENYVQELVAKQASLPKDIYWHFIGHLQSNKVKYIAPFVYCIHSIDSYKLLLEVNKQAAKHNRIINCLLQVHVAQEETKFGFDEDELMDVLQDTVLKNLQHICIKGIMGMASFTHNEQQLKNEFTQLQTIFINLSQHSKQLALQNVDIKEASFGMSGDYKLALQYGTTMIRVGSLLFGSRE
jgi:hypothetical protein